MRPLLLLHGALGAPGQLQPLADRLGAHYQCFAPAFPGHAGEAAEEFSMERLASFLEEYIAARELHQPLVFGYSMGGYAALTLEARRPGTFAAISTLATKFAWSPEGAAREVKQLQPDVIETKLPAFAETLKHRHAPLDWKEVVTRTAGMMKTLGDAPPLTADALAAIAAPVFLLLGDRDNMVSYDETAQVQKSIAGAQLCMLPATPHPLEKADAELLAHLLYRFFDQTAPQS